MIKLLLPIPMEVYIAFSGGVDSMTVAHFLQRGGRKVHLLHFNHGSEHASFFQDECIKFATQYGMQYSILSWDKANSKPSDQSLEEFWRRQRYKALRGFAKIHGIKFITCHHLNDAAETWLWSAMHGTPKLIPYTDEHLYRPFLTTEKQSFIDYAEKHNLPVAFDPSNNDQKIMRNYMRANIIPHAYHVNPGLNKVIRKKYMALVNS